MPGVELIDRTGESDEAVAMSVLALLDGAQSGERNGA
jgi:hypothetical protein